MVGGWWIKKMDGWVDTKQMNGGMDRRNRWIGRKNGWMVVWIDKKNRWMVGRKTKI